MSNKELFLKEGLLWIAMVFGSYGASVLSTAFVKGAVSLVIAAGIYFVRGYVKKYFVAKTKKEKSE